MRGSKPTKMKNTDYRDGLHLVVAGRIPQVLAGDGTKRHDEEAESREVADGSGRREKVGLRRSWLWGEMGV